LKTFVWFKEEKERVEFFQLHPRLQLIAMEMSLWCYERNLDFVITETFTSIHDDNNLERKSSAHREGRAFDFSDRGWSSLNIQHFITYFNNKFRDIAAVSASSGVRTLVVHHKVPNNVLHFHVQLDRSFAVT